MINYDTQRTPVHAIHVTFVLEESASYTTRAQWVPEVGDGRIGVVELDTGLYTHVNVQGTPPELRAFAAALARAADQAERGLAAWQLVAPLVAPRWPA
jgi:hypothetical protein